MIDHFEYKEYLGTIEPNISEGFLQGKLAFIVDRVTYKANTLDKLEQAFKLAVDEYLSKSLNKKITPDKPLKGSFSVRTHPHIHRKAAILANKNQQKLNAFVCEAIAEKIERAGC